MARIWTIRANFPRQSSDLVEVVEAGSWPVAIGKAARAMKIRMKGSKITVMSLTMELTGHRAEPAASEPAQAEPVAAETDQPSVPADPINKLD